ncbi:MAG: hypothetical protein IKQ82_02070 [Lentisphaeria bacterium]|nr:hypothetical protein [Lentisphaeria bacterium]
MKQQPHPQNTKDAPRTSTWKESLRRHTTGPVFSLSVHIVILALLGSIMIAVVPKASHDDVTVEITEKISDLQEALMTQCIMKVKS